MAGTYYLHINKCTNPLDTIDLSRVTQIKRLEPSTLFANAVPCFVAVSVFAYALIEYFCMLHLCEFSII